MWCARDQSGASHMRLGSQSYSAPRGRSALIRDTTYYRRVGVVLVEFLSDFSPFAGVIGTESFRCLVALMRCVLRYGNLDIILSFILQE